MGFINKCWRGLGRVRFNHFYLELRLDSPSGSQKCFGKKKLFRVRNGLTAHGKAGWSLSSPATSPPGVPAPTLALLVFLTLGLCMKFQTLVLDWPGFKGHSTGNWRRCRSQIRRYSFNFSIQKRPEYARSCFLNLGSRGGGEIAQWVKPLMGGCEIGFQIPAAM